MRPPELWPEIVLRWLLLLGMAALCVVGWVLIFGLVGALWFGVSIVVGLVLIESAAVLGRRWRR